MIELGPKARNGLRENDADAFCYQEMHRAGEELDDIQSSLARWGMADDGSGSATQ